MGTTHRQTVVAAAASAAIAVLLATGCAPKLSATSGVLEHDVAALHRLFVLVNTPRLDDLADWWGVNRRVPEMLSEEFADGLSGALEARLVQALAAAGAEVEAANPADFDLGRAAGTRGSRDFELGVILVVDEEDVLMDEMRCTRVVIAAELRENGNGATRPVMWRARVVLDPHSPDAAIRLKDIPDAVADALLNRLRADGMADLLTNPGGNGLQPN